MNMILYFLVITNTVYSNILGTIIVISVYVGLSYQVISYFSIFGQKSLLIHTYEMLIPSYRTFLLFHFTSKRCHITKLTHLLYS